MNLGTIVETPLLKVRLRGGPVLGEVEEWFVSTLTPGDCFIFAGQTLRFEALDALACVVTRGGEGEPRVPAYAGSRMPLTTHLAARVRAILSDPAAWAALPAPVQEWLRLQTRASMLPPKDGLLVETFPRGGRWFLVAYCFEGRLAHQTLGMLVTKRMERMGMGRSATSAPTTCWRLVRLRADRGPPAVRGGHPRRGAGGVDGGEQHAPPLLPQHRDHRRADREEPPGAEKSGRQMTMNADLIYDVLRKHEPDHILLRATRREAASGLTDVARIGLLLARANRGGITHHRLDRVSPLAVPALIEEGREWVAGGAEDALLAEAAALVADATDGAEIFSEVLANVTEGIRPARDRDRPRRPRKIEEARAKAARMRASCERAEGIDQDSMTAAPIHLSGERLMLDPAGLLAWPAQRTLVVADLHLEKGSHFATRGSFVPPYDTRETLERLALALRRWKPARLVMLGDSFHDARGCARLGDAERAALRRMLDGIEAVWVLGNHDPVAPEDLPGEAVEEWRLGPLAFRHIAKPGAAGRSRATSIRRRACRLGRGM
jgi:DNA ligase-associated metallophosphoesterase